MKRKAATNAANSLPRLAIVSPSPIVLRLFFLDHPIGLVGMSIELRAESCFCRLALAGRHFPLLSLGAHEIEIAAFIGLQNGLKEQMRVAAFGPFRRRQFERRAA